MQTTESGSEFKSSGPFYYIISLDPAQLHDYSALAVLQVSRAEKKKVYRLVSLNRKQHLPYTEIVTWAKRVYLNPKFRRDISFLPEFLLDVGGVGMALRDMLAAEGVESVGIQLTGGDTASRAGNICYVSKGRLVGKFLGAWDEGRVLMPSTASFLSPFQKELRAFRGEMSSRGRVRFEAEQGEHDDLVLSVGQAVWWGETQPEEIELGEDLVIGDPGYISGRGFYEASWGLAPGDRGYSGMF